MGYYSKRRAIPKFLISFVLLVLTAGAVVHFAYLPSEDAVMSWFCFVGEFVCKYDTILIGILLGINLIEFIDLVVFAKRDEEINKSFELAAGNSIGFLTLFKHYFLGVYCRGPFIYATQERGSALPRTIITLTTNIIKFAAWVILMLSAAGTIFKESVYEFSITEGADYNFTIFVLLLCLNCNIFAFALYRMLPLHESRTYKVTEYYSDGSRKTSTEHSSNFIAILILSGILYLLYTAYFIFPLSNKIARSIETSRFCKFIDDSQYNECIWDFYG